MICYRRIDPEVVKILKVRGDGVGIKKESSSPLCEVESFLSRCQDNYAILGYKIFEG